MFFNKKSTKGLLFTLLFSGFQIPSTLLITPQNNPDLWQDWILLLENSAEQIQGMVSQFLEPWQMTFARASHPFPFRQNFLGGDNKNYELEVDMAEIPKETNGKEVYDRIATLQSVDGNGNKIKTAEVLWDTKKSGALPGPESSLIKTRFDQQGVLYQMESKSNEINTDGKIYYKTELKYSLVGPSGQPLKRGFAEIFRDIQRQETVVSTSLMEGPANINPKEMVQLNLQGVLGASGYIYLRGGQSSPVMVGKNQQHFCNSPEGEWVEEKSTAWKENCAPLLNKSDWLGFAFDAIPTH